MSPNGVKPGLLSRFRHPRLMVFVVVGALIGLLGTLLALVTPPLGGDELGLRLAILGYIAFLIGGSGYLAFSVFERKFD